jgi:hypothetical protein
VLVGQRLYDGTDPGGGWRRPDALSTAHDPCPASQISGCCSVPIHAQHL